MATGVHLRRQADHLYYSWVSAWPTSSVPARRDAQCRTAVSAAGGGYAPALLERARSLPGAGLEQAESREQFCRHVGP